MSILIDGYNLMHAAGLMKPRFGPGGLEKARRALLGILAGSLAEDAARTTVVFDARVTPQRAEGQRESSEAVQSVQVEFAAGEEGADARIEKLIRIDSAPRQLTVVSSDARIRRAAQRRGSRAVDSETFWDDLLARRRKRSQAKSESPPEKPTGRAARNSEFWLREFEGLIDEDDLRELGWPDFEE